MTKQKWLINKILYELDLTFNFYDEDSKELIENIIPSIQFYTNGFILYFNVKLRDRTKLSIDVAKFINKEGFVFWNEDYPLPINKIKKIIEIAEQYKNMEE